ncbi:hypothetical protein JXJ21_25370 [candidate division KSB1 bacterium]|nr:hypothetical protein [candidate division KSB1 bacterium]
MTSKERLLTAWSFKEADRVPIELQISPSAYEYPEASNIVAFIDSEADNFLHAPGGDFGFFGLKCTYHEEIIEDIPNQYKRIRRSYNTAVGEFDAITKHNYDEIIPTDFHWERRYIHTLEDMERLTAAPREKIPLRKDEFVRAVTTIGDRGVPLVGILHPLGYLVRHANMEEVYGWLLTDSKLMHQFLETTNTQIAAAVEAMSAAGIGPYFFVCAHEMLIPPWMGMRQFDEFVFPYDKMVNDAIRRHGGRLRIHCHGNCMDYLERFWEMGVDAIEPLEAPPLGNVDLVEAKKRIGDRMLLSGNIPSHDFVRMTRDEVRTSVKQTLSAAARGGGFTLRTVGGHAATNSVKSKAQMLKIFDNIEAYIEAGLEFGSYPIKL